MSTIGNQQKRQKPDERVGTIVILQEEGEKLGLESFECVSGEDVYNLLKIQQDAALPDADKMFPWLHGFSQAHLPLTEKFQLSIIRSQVLPVGKIENSGILKSSMDLRELLLPYKEAYQDLKEILELEVKEYGLLTGYTASENDIEELMSACNSFKLLPFLVTDTLKQYKYGRRKQLGQPLGACGVAWKQPSMFRRFDLQPAKHFELSKHIVIYCLCETHRISCGCNKAAVMARWASRFVRLNYLEHKAQKPDIRILESVMSVPRDLMGIDSMSVDALEKKIAGQLASNFDLASFSNWERDLLYKERLEISKMSSMTLVSEHLLCGNSTDYEVLKLKRVADTENTDRRYYSQYNTIVSLQRTELADDDILRVDGKLFNLVPKCSIRCTLFIHCVENVPFPQSSIIESHLRELQGPTHLVFPSSGSVGLGNLTLESIGTFVNVCHLIHQVGCKTNLLTLLYCSDGYTETSFLLVAYLIFIWDLPLEEALLRLHTELERPFFLFPVDVQVLGHIQMVLRELSPLRHPDRETAPLTIDPALFSKMFFTKPRGDPMYLRSKGPLPSKILPHMYLGSLEHAQHPDLLRDLGIKNIVSVGEKLPWLQNHRTTGVLQSSLIHHVRPVSAASITTVKPHNPVPSIGTSGSILNVEKVNILKGTKSVSFNGMSLKEAACETKIITEDGFNICHIKNLGDNGADPLLAQLELVLSFIDECYKRGEKVLVHCMVGVSRSATVCIAECMRRLNCGVLQAYLFVRVRRLNIIIQPNLMFIYDLLKWQELHHPEAVKIEWHIVCRAIAELNSNYIKDNL